MSWRQPRHFCELWSRRLWPPACSHRGVPGSSAPAAAAASRSYGWTGCPWSLSCWTTRLQPLHHKPRRWDKKQAKKIFNLGSYFIQLACNVTPKDNKLKLMKGGILPMFLVNYNSTNAQNPAWLRYETTQAKIGQKWLTTKLCCPSTTIS